MTTCRIAASAATSLALLIALKGGVYADPADTTLSSTVRGLVPRTRRPLCGPSAAGRDTLRQLIQRYVSRSAPAAGRCLTPAERPRFGLCAAAGKAASKAEQAEQAKQAEQAEQAEQAKQAEQCDATSEAAAAGGGQSQQARPFACEVWDARFTKTKWKQLELGEGKSETPVASARRVYDCVKKFYELNREMGFDLMKITTGPIRASVRNCPYDGAQCIDTDRGKALLVGTVRRLATEIKDEPDVDYSKDPCAIYHELGHAMGDCVLTTRDRGTADEPNFGVKDFTPRDEPGAVEESLADVYAAMGVQYAAGLNLGQLREEHWVLGAAVCQGIKGCESHPVGVRNMLHPGTAYDDPQWGGKDPQPEHMKSFYRGTFDDGGIHINSGIPNRAFAVASMALAKSMPQATIWETTGSVWLHAMKRLGQDATFQDVANATYETAKELFPKNAAIADAIQEGWSTVGVPAAGAKGVMR